MAQPIVLELKNITKSFPGIIANDHINFDLKKGEIHTLLGENGAGKSTLMNIISGLYPADEGELIVNGEKTNFLNPKQAILAGIGMVHQHFMLIKNHTVAENIILGTPQNFHLSSKKIFKEITTISEEYGLYVDPSRKIQNLSVGEQQRVEILKVLYRGAQILILDEPTAVLSPQESESLFKILHKMVATGHSVIFISHKMKEVLAISDRITILSKGKILKTVQRDTTTAEALAKIMMGERKVFSVSSKDSQSKLDTKTQSTVRQNTVIELKNLYADNKQGQPVLNNLSLEIKSGEILGLAGISGNGQSELAKVLGGLIPFKKGEYLFEGEALDKVSVAKMIKLGVGYIPEDRKRFGIAKGLSIGNNFLIRDYQNPYFYQNKVINWHKVYKYARKKMTEFDIRAPSEKTFIGKLSGGNIQKTILSREISRSIKFLLANQPIRGLDVNAAEDIRELILKAKESGLAILLISEDLDEILTISDRIAVIYNGKIQKIISRDEANIEEIGLIMTGISD